MRRPEFFALALALAAALGCRFEPSEEPSGAALYARHCAACHGAEARGDGPVAPALSRPPPDLTTLARRNGGRFDAQRVAAAIDGRSPVVGHGSREMPVWGVVFEQEIRGEPFVGYRAIERSQSLTDYLATLQVE
jgi:mono/diheme cytochrome c family protein